VLNVEYNIIDDLDRPREIATFQIDIGNAERFGIQYTNQDGVKKYPVIIHTAVIGGLERFMFTLLDTAVRLEREGKKPMLPVWASPVQVRIIPVARQIVPDAKKILETFDSSGVRGDLDDRDDTLQSKIREAELSWIPYVVVYGEKEKSTGKLSIRKRSDGTEMKTTVHEFLNHIREETGNYPTRTLSYPQLLSQRPGYKKM
jgi:threonyl-tRNA synthetase